MYIIKGNDSLDEYIEDMCMMAAGVASGVWMQRHPTEVMPVEEIVDVVQNMLKEENDPFTPSYEWIRQQVMSEFLFS